MARTKQTARKQLKLMDHNEAEIEMSEDVEIDPATEVNGVANLYRHDCPSYNCCPSRWSRYSNHNAEQQWIAKETHGIPIVHRQVFDNKSWVTKDFTVQDPTMRAFLQNSLENYQDFDLELVNWTFTPPFSPLVHRWDQLSAPDHTTESPEPVRQLMKFLDPLLKTSVEALIRTRKTGKVDFDNLWHIFPPGGHALTTLYGTETVCRITKHERFDPCNKPPFWVISLEYLDWNGEKSGYTDTKVHIGFFPGFRHVVSLPVYPLSFHKAAAEVQSRMIERGRKFEQLRGYNYRTCNGTKVLLQTEEPELRPVSGRVVVDAFAYYRNNDIVKLDLKPLEGEEGSTTINGKGKKKRARADSSASSHTDSWQDGNISEGPTMKAIEVLGSAKSRVEIKSVLTDEQCLLATPWLRGLDMQTKEWALFNVDELSPVEWNDAAFDHLVLPGNEKHLSWNFVENQALAKNTFDDFVRDKGRGIIILMYGPPGVGKTFTAEAVAERARVPLYSMSAGTLGTDPAEVEKTLTKALDLCELWNAMLLLDEADIFLTARTNSDLLRNELVAIFLMKLEYYPGICFLTTNRISSLDHAFQSRVDLFLPYTDLTVAARRQVWSHFMARTGQGKFNISESEMDTLAEAQLNGREIKNLVKSAHLLSLKDGQQIGMERVYDLAQNRLKALAAMAEQ